MNDPREIPYGLLWEAFDFCQDGIAITDIQGKIVSGNRRLEELTGYAVNELRECHISKFIQDFPQKCFVEYMVKNKSGKAILVSKSGKSLTVELRVRTLEQLKDRNRGYLVVLRDLTEITALRRDLHVVQQELEDLHSGEEDNSLDSLEWEISQLEGRLRETENFLDIIRCQRI